LFHFTPFSLLLFLKVKHMRGKKAHSISF